MSETNTALSFPTRAAPLPAPVPAHGRRLLDVGRLRRAAAAYLSACGVGDDDTRAGIVDEMLALPTAADTLVRADGSIDAAALQRRLDGALAPSPIEQPSGCGRLMHAWGVRGLTAEQWRRDVTVRDDAPVEMPVQSLSDSRDGAAARHEHGLRRFVRAPAHAVVLLVSVLLGGK